MSFVKHRIAAAGLCLLIVAAGVWIAKTSDPSLPSQPPAVRWVHTSDGWQIAAWEYDRPAREPALHPILVAAFVSLASATVLVALSARKGPQTEQGDEVDRD